MAKENGRSQQNFRNPGAFNLALGLGILATSLALALYGYLGTFSRYGSDDYCLSAFFHREGSFLQLMVERYMTSSSRYTNILFIGLADKLLGWYNVAILPPLMLALFVWGTYLFLKEIVRLASLGWSRLLILFLALLVVYFSVMQAPNLYETLYWRAGMTSHFAPVVFLTFLGAFLTREIRLAAERPPQIWSPFLCFLGALFVGGFSEPPLTMLITILVLGLIALWIWDHSPARRARFSLIIWTLAGSILALVILALAPANSLRLGTPPPGLVELVMKTFKYPLEFMVDVFRSLYLPTLITFLLPAVLFYVYYSQREPASHAYDTRWIVLIDRRCIPSLLLVNRGQFCSKCIWSVLPCGEGPFLRKGHLKLCFNGKWCFNWHAGCTDQNEAQSVGGSILPGNHRPSAADPLPPADRLTPGCRHPRLSAACRSLGCTGHENPSAPGLWRARFTSAVFVGRVNAGFG